MTDIRKKRLFLRVQVEGGAVIVNPILYLRSRYGVQWSLSDPLKRSAAKDRNCKAVCERQPFWNGRA